MEPNSFSHCLTSGDIQVQQSSLQAIAMMYLSKKFRVFVINFSSSDELEYVSNAWACSTFALSGLMITIFKPLKCPLIFYLGTISTLFIITLPMFVLLFPPDYTVITIVLLFYLLALFNISSGSLTLFKRLFVSFYIS